MTQTGFIRNLSCLGVIVFFASCAPVIAPFSQRAYELATELKVDSPKLMDRAEEPYANHAERIERLSIELEKAYEFARGRPDNAHSTRQWEILLDPDQHLLGGFIGRWESEGSLSYTFIAESKKVVSEAFDTVIGLESGKIRFDQ